MNIKAASAPFKAIAKHFDVSYTAVLNYGWHQLQRRRNGGMQNLTPHTEAAILELQDKLNPCNDKDFRVAIGEALDRIAPLPANMAE